MPSALRVRTVPALLAIVRHPETGRPLLCSLVLCEHCNAVHHHPWPEIGRLHTEKVVQAKCKQLAPGTAPQYRVLLHPQYRSQAYDIYAEFRDRLDTFLELGQPLTIAHAAEIEGSDGEPASTRRMRVSARTRLAPEASRRRGVGTGLNAFDLRAVRARQTG